MSNKLLSITETGTQLESATHSDGLQLKHGFVNRTSSTLAFDNNSHIFTLGVATTATVYLNGVAYTIASPGLTIDLDTKTLSNGLWFIWVEVSGGNAVLNASQTAWSITNLTITPCVTVYWNGTAGALGEERHSADRNLPDHLWKHLTVGARIQNDGSFAQTLPTTAVDAKIELVAGYLWDEDIANAISTAQGKLVRNWYETAAAVWTFADGTDNAGNDRPYIWNAATSRLRYPSTALAYALTDSANNTHIPVWVYASNDVTRPIYLVTPALSAGYGTVAQARAALQPTLPFAAELKLLWRWIFRGDGEYQEAADYRTSSSLPGGGVASPTALSVSFAPAGDIAALNVQAAIEELDIEKAPLASPTFTGIITTAGQIKFPATQSASADANTLDDYEEGTWTATYGIRSVTGQYTKIGVLVYVYALLDNTATFSAITGLPFTVGSSGYVPASMTRGLGSNVDVSTLHAGATSTQIDFVAPSTGTIQTLTTTGTVRIEISCTYQV